MSRIMLIGPTFFGYRKRIEDELSSRGHIVDCADDRPSETVLFKSVAKFGYAPVEWRIEAYAGELTSRLEQGEYDQVIYLGGMTFCFTRRQFERMRAASGATFVAYLWDSIANSRRLSRSLVLFDRILSFEPADCRSHGIDLRPLFFSDEHRGIPLVPEGGFEYDACFIGSAHQPSKFKAVKAICMALRDCGLRVYEYYYMPSRSAELLRKSTSGAYRGVEFQRRPLGTAEVAGIYARSRAIIDSPQSGQGGLTMRTIEAVGSRRKLVTANPDAARYDIASTGQVLVWNGVAHEVSTFFSEPYRPLPDDVYERYSISSFVDALVGGSGPYSGYLPEGSDAS